MRKVLITGATGFLGRYILQSLLDDENIAPIVLARGRKDRSAEERVADAIKYLYGDDRYKRLVARVRVVEGEVDKKNLGIEEKIRCQLIDEVDEIFHSAAIAEFRVPLEAIRTSNVEGARNLFEFSLECKKRGRLSKVNHISTTYVVGDRAGVFYEDQLDLDQHFNNTYEQSKYEAELLVQGYRARGLPITVFRPSILTGDSGSGRTSNFKMLYQPLHFFANELYDAVPANYDTQENLLPTDIAAQEIVLIAAEHESVNKTYHIASPVCVAVGHFVDVAADFFGFKKPELIPLESFDMSALTAIQKTLIDPFVPYFNYKTLFDISNAKEILQKKNYSYSGFDDVQMMKLFAFCADSGFIKPKRRYVSAG